MNQEEKSQLTGWIVIGAIVAVMVVGVFYVNRNPGSSLDEISPAAGDYTTNSPANMSNDGDLGYEAPTTPSEPAQPVTP